MKRGFKDTINLLPREAKKAGSGLWMTAAMAVIFVLAWGAAFGWQFSAAWRMKSRETTLSAKREMLIQETESLAREMGASVAAGANPQTAALITSLLQERVLWSDVFKQFSLIVPKGLWFDNLEGSTEGRAEIKIKGGAFNYLSVAEFMLSMEKSTYFEKPQLLYAQKAVVQGQDVIGFEILCGIKKRQEAR